MMLDFSQHPITCNVTDDISLSLTEGKGTECLLRLTTDSCTVERPTNPDLFDPSVESDPEETISLTESLALAIEYNHEEFHDAFLWTLFEIRNKIRAYRGPVHQFNSNFGVRPCEPPEWTVEQLNKESKWTEIEARYEAWAERDTLELWEDDPGTGKTTSTAKGAAASGRTHVFYLPTHENCREFIADKEKPNGYFNLKGAGQHLHRCCADAETEGTTCSEHPEHPAMCPIFDKPVDHPLRVAYEWIAAEKGGNAAHRELKLFDKDWHPTDACAWLEQFDELEQSSRVVTVHTYLGHGVLDGFEDHIIDDLQNVPAIQQGLTPSKVESVQRVLEVLAEDQKSSIAEVYQALSDVADELLTSLRERRDSFDSIPAAEFSTPAFVERRCNSDLDANAEALAWAKHGYMEYLHSHLITKDTIGLPSTIDFLLMIAGYADSGISVKSARRAIEAQAYVNICPRCDKVLEQSGGWHTCSSCDWSEHTDSLTTPDMAQARSSAWLSVPSKKDSDKRGRTATIEYQRVRSPSELPPAENTLILDATPTPALYAHVFDTEESTINRVGTEKVVLNADIIQIVNGQYPRSTICETKHGDAGERRREKIQTLINDVCNRNEEVVLIGHKRARKYFREPQNSTWIDFYAGRGLDRPSADAIIVIGAPFPNERGLKRTAEALTVNGDVELGEIIHDREALSDQNVLETERPYWYIDEEGNGYSVKVKPRHGLLGELFTDRVERELVQMLHRIRPVIAESPKEIYLLTNIPLSVPITTLTTLDELSAVARSEPVEILTPKAREIVSLLAPWFGTHPRRRGLSAAWKVNDDEITATVSDIHTLYRENIEDTTRQSIQNGLDDLRARGVISRSSKRQGRLGYIYTFPRSTCVPLEFVIANSAELSLSARQRLQGCIPNSGVDATGGWTTEASEIVSTDASSSRL